MVERCGGTEEQSCWKSGIVMVEQWKSNGGTVEQWNSNCGTVEQ